ncbi:MAG: OmpA family protein [Pseudomonadota bacterium]
MDRERFDREERDNLTRPILAIILILLLLVVFIFWRGAQLAEAESAPEPALAPIVEPTAPDPEPAPDPKPEPAPAPEPDPIPEPEPAIDPEPLAAPVEPEPEAPPPPIEEPAPAPPPPPDPIQATVYFELMSAKLTLEAQDLLAASFADADWGAASSISVEGFTDTAGAVDYNVALSRARAGAVRAALIAAGAPSPAIDMSWYGETRLATETPDGVREPLNRRASVTIRFD